VTEPSAIRLVVSDVDGTLVDPSKQITPGVAAAVERLRQAGLPFTIISARPRSGLMPIADALAIDTPLGAFNGGIVFTRDGHVRCHHMIDRAVVEAAFAAAQGLAVDTWVFADDLWYASTDQGSHVGSERTASNQAPIVTQDFASLYDRADKVTFVSDDPDLLIALHDRIAGYADRATIAQSQTYYLDITALPANKGVGVATLAEVIGVPLEQTAVFGDQANDLPIFARAGLSYAMGQGPEDVRSKADRVVAGNDEDGVAQAIDAILASR
jgi:Cof subfamily protein (haloacid dehalogenase superfamily)